MAMIIIFIGETGNVIAANKQVDAAK